MRGWRRAVAGGVVLCAMLVLSKLRGTALDVHRGAFVGCDGCFSELALLSDVAIVALAALLLAVLASLRMRRIRLPVATGALLLVALMAVDAGTSATLGHRLLLADLRLYGDETGAIGDVAASWLATVEGLSALAAFLAAAGGLAVAAISREDVTRRNPAVFVGLAALLGATAWTGGPPRYADLAFFQNVISVQFLDTGLRHHSSEAAARYYAMPEPPRHCQGTAGTGLPKAVFVLVLESWSLHHSALFSGLSDQTPRLDAWARRGRWYPDFVANSYSTETALISLLNGRVPIPSHRAWGATAFADVEGDWHRALDAQGTWTGFFTTGDLGFGDRRQFLEGIGIRHREGGEHPFYAGRPRGPFEAASDRALFERVLQWYDQERPSSPFMATVLTVGSHPPFVDSEPEDPHEPGERAALRRMDDAVANFLEALDQRGFFRDGLVFVTGDHRAMTPVAQNEVDRFGESSLSRVPAFAVGKSVDSPGPIDGTFQHTDLVPSLLALQDADECRTNWQGHLFGPAPTPAQVVVYAHPALRNELRVLVGGQRFRLRLDGDATGWVGDAPADGKAILDEVVRQRLSRDPRHQ